MNNGRFPTPPGKGTIQITGGSQNSGMPVVGAAQPQQPGMPGMTNQVTPHQQLLSIIKSGSSNNHVNYKDTTETGIRYDTINDYFNQDGGDADLQKIREQEVKNYLSSTIIQVANEFQNHINRYAVIEEAFKFLSIKYVNHAITAGAIPNVSATAERFWTVALKSAANRRAVGINIGTVFCHNLACLLLSGEQPSQNQITTFLKAAADHIFALEIGRWLTASGNAREFSRASGHLEEKFREGVLRQINHVQEAVSNTFAFFEIPCPYDNWEPCFEEKMDSRANPVGYQLKPEPTNDYPIYGVRPKWEADKDGNFNQAARENIQSMDYLISRKAAMAKEASVQNHIQERVSDPNFISFGPEYTGRTDFENMTDQNIIEFDWKRKLVNVPGTEFFIATDELLRGLRNAYYPGQYNAIPVQWDKVTLLTLIDGKPSKDVLLIDMGFYTMEKFLTDPAKLLPLLKEINGKIVLADEVDTGYGEDGEYDLDEVIEVTRLSDKPVINYLPGHVTGDWDVYDRSAGLVHKEVDDTTGKPIATSYAETQFKEIELEAEVIAKNTVSDLKVLIKDSGTFDGNYFDFIEIVYRKLVRNHLDKPKLVTEIDKYLSSELERFFIEKHGYHNTDTKPFHFKVSTLTDCYEELGEIFSEQFPEIYEVLVNKKTARSLINRSKCLLNYETGVRYLGDLLNDESPTFKYEEALTKRTVCLARECVITRVSNIPIPVKDGRAYIARVKRSERPELFHIVERSYGKLVNKYLSSGAEQIVIFVSAGGSRWTFQSSAYDATNVATMRRLEDRTDLVDLDLLETRY